VDSHGFFLRSQGGEEAVVEALARGDLESAPVTDAERALLRFVETVTRHAYRTTENDVALLRGHGWTDPQIAEAVYVTAMFAFFNRVADAFGIVGQGYGGPRPDFSRLNEPAGK
jgi:uncharacterized peroxidase-related enzyme